MTWPGGTLSWLGVSLSLITGVPPKKNLGPETGVPPFPSGEQTNRKHYLPVSFGMRVVIKFLVSGQEIIQHGRSEPFESTENYSVLFYTLLT